MNTLIDNVYKILTSTPENIIYHLVLAFAVMATLQTALILRRNGGTSRRLIVGLVVLLMGQLLLFLASALTWQGLANPQIFLPPVDRAITTLSILWAVWLWAFPKPQRLADAFTALLTLAVIVLFLITYAAWNRNPLVAGFNTSNLDTVWAIFTIFLLATGVLLLIFRRPAGWGVGVGFSVLLLAGALVHLMWGKAVGDYSAPLRLAMLCAYPLLPSLAAHLQPQRTAPLASIERSASSLNAPVLAYETPIVERRRYTADPRTTYTWLQLAADKEPQHVPYALARAIAQSMVADLCILVSSPPHGMVNFESGYDLIQEEELAPAAMRQDGLPALTDALQRGETLILNTNPDAPDQGLMQLAQTLGLDQSGNMMVVPLVGGKLKASGMLLISPYSNRQWNAEDQTYLMGLSEIISRVLQQASHRSAPEMDTSGLQEDLEITLSSLSAMQLEMEQSRIRMTSLTGELESAQQAAQASQSALETARSEYAALQEELDSVREAHIHLQQELESTHTNRGDLEKQHLELKAREESLVQELQEARDSITTLHTEMEQLSGKNEHLVAEIERLTQEMELQKTVETTSLDTLRQEEEQLQSTLQALKAENATLRESLQAAQAEEPELQAQFRMTLAETAHLKNVLAEANTKIAVLENKLNGPAPLSANDQKMIVGLGQELRQPLASIIGYSDLLLSEKTGILGALQHRLMLRVKQSTQRMEQLLEDINAIISRSGDRETSVVTVDFNAIVDKTIARVGTALRDKDIALQFDLPENIPAVHVDEDSIEQVVYYLMQNAILATPKEGSISLQVQVKDEADQPHFLIQVVDSGGGIAMEDLPRIFSRTYLEDHPEISGLGDQGVGLSIAKTLTEAHKGRIWVDSDLGSTTTFSVLFPFRLDETLTTDE